MKKILIILLIFLALIGMVALLKNLGQRKVIARLVSVNTNEINELHFRLNLLGIIPVGEAVILKERMEEYQGRKVFHLRAFAFTSKFLSPFFSGKAEVNSLIDRQDLNPLMFSQNLFVKDKYDINKEVFYDQKEGVMTIAGVRRVITPGTKDPLSAMFFLRRMDPEAIKDFEFNINTNQKTYILKGEAQIQNESINGKLCQLIRLKANISRRDKNPYHKSSVSMLLVRVRENIPVKIEVFAGGVFLEVVLMDIK